MNSSNISIQLSLKDENGEVLREKSKPIELSAQQMFSCRRNHFLSSKSQRQYSGEMQFNY